MSEDKNKIEFYDKRRIKSADDTCDDALEADLDRLPTFVEKMKAESEASQRQLKEYITAHKEKMAELDQLRKRLEADVERRALARFGDLIKDLFPSVDDFDRAIEQAAKTNPDDPLLEGVRLMRDGLLKVLAERGLEVINCENEPFDPEVAQAVSVEPVDDEEKDNVVVEQLAPGYRFEGRVLRPALVRVGQKAGKEK